jgi:outer membrane protein assembly factor BamE (lipoprotein component of BamABCDE complex)
VRDDTVKVAVIENAVEAGLVGAILTERSIPHAIRSFHDPAYDGIFQLQRGWGAVYAPSAYKEEILRILSDIRSSASSETECDHADVRAFVESFEAENETTRGSAQARNSFQDSEDTKHSKDD